MINHLFISLCSFILACFLCFIYVIVNYFNHENKK